MTWKALLVMGCGLAAMPAEAGVIYSETFSNESSLASDPLVNYSAISPYFVDQSWASQNGYVVSSSNMYGTISAPQAGSSNFLLDTTFSPTGSATQLQGNFTGNDIFFASSNFAVAPNTNYTVSFYLTNPNSVQYPSIELVVNGATLLTGVSAKGSYGDGNALDQWQQFTATWNSGTSTSASLQLLDTNLQCLGNDFAVDTIQVSTQTSSAATTSTPEPGSMILLGSGMLLVGLFAVRRIREKRASV